MDHNPVTLGGWLLHVMKSSESAMSFEEALHAVMDSLKDYFPCQSAAVVLIDDETKEVHLKMSRHISYTFAKKFRLDQPGPVVSRVVLQQEHVLANHLDSNSDLYREIKMEHEFDSVLIVPVIMNQRGVGYLFCDRASGQEFSDADLLHMQVLGHLAGQLMYKFELLRESSALSQIDDASKALKYKAFVPAFSTEMDRAKEHSYPLVLALLSVDAFRKYVQVYGIVEAHAMLADVVSLLAPHIRDMDLLARYSADAFVMCLSGKTEVEARALLQKMAQDVQNKAIRHPEVPLRLLAGAVSLADTADLKRPLHDILAAAGKCLVEASTTGRDLLCIRRLSI